MMVNQNFTEHSQKLPGGGQLSDFMKKKIMDSD